MAKMRTILNIKCTQVMHLRWSSVRVLHYRNICELILLHLVLGNLGRWFKSAKWNDLVGRKFCWNPESKTEKKNSFHNFLSWFICVIVPQQFHCISFCMFNQFVYVWFAPSFVTCSCWTCAKLCAIVSCCLCLICVCVCVETSSFYDFYF